MLESTRSRRGQIVKLLHAFVNPSTASDTAVVAAPGANLAIVVTSSVIVTTLANSVLFKSATNAITATWPLAANGGLVLAQNDDGWFETNVNEALNFTTNVATACGCLVSYYVEQR